MRTDWILRPSAYAAAAAITLALLGTPATTQELPSYMAPIAGRPASSPAETSSVCPCATGTRVDP